MKKKTLKLGIIGQNDGKCCRGYCLDCEVIRAKSRKKEQSLNLDDYDKWKRNTRMFS